MMLMVCSEVYDSLRMMMLYEMMYEMMKRAIYICDIYRGIGYTLALT